MPRYRIAKKLSQNRLLAESAEPSVPVCGTGQLYESKVVASMFIIANQNGPALGQPTQRPLDHPAARFMPALPIAGFLLLTDTADVWCVTARRGGLLAGRVIIAFVQAQVLR